MADLWNLNIETLPSEVLENVAGYLDDKSVLKWSSASNYMRNVLNNDWVWKRFCLFDEEVYKSWGEPRVRPIFDKEDSPLSTFCKCKTNYMKQAHLMRNWMQGVYQLEDDIEIERNTLDCEKYLFASCFFGNHHLFLYLMDLRTIEALGLIFNVQESPFTNSTHKLSGFSSDESLAQMRTAKVKVTLIEHSNKVAFSFCEVCLVFDINVAAPSMELRNAFLFCNAQAFSDPAEVGSFMRVHDYGQVCPVIVTQKHFIGAKRCTGDRSSFRIHFWDINKADKLKMVQVPPGDVSLTVLGLEFVCAQNEENLIVRLLVRNHRYGNLYYGFDLSKLEFSSFKVQVNYCVFVLLEKDRAVGLGPRQLYLYNYQTSEKIVKKEHSHEILPKTVVVVGDHLVYGLVDNTVSVVDILTGVPVSKIKLNFTLYSMKPLMGKFVVVNSNNSVVMQVGKQVKSLFKLPVDASFEAINKSGTKMAVKRRNRIIIMNFW